MMCKTIINVDFGSVTHQVSAKLNYILLCEIIFSNIQIKYLEIIGTKFDERLGIRK